MGCMQTFHLRRITTIKKPDLKQLCHRPRVLSAHIVLILRIYQKYIKYILRIYQNVSEKCLVCCGGIGKYEDDACKVIFKLFGFPDLKKSWRLDF